MKGGKGEGGEAVNEGLRMKGATLSLSTVAVGGLCAPTALEQSRVVVINTCASSGTIVAVEAWTECGMSVRECRTPSEHFGLPPGRGLKTTLRPYVRLRYGHSHGQYTATG